MLYTCFTYHIVGNFGEVFNLEIWRFGGKLPLCHFDMYDVMTSSAVTKFKIRQYSLGSDWPSLMFNARQSFPRYTVVATPYTVTATTILTCSYMYRGNFLAVQDCLSICFSLSSYELLLYIYKHYTMSYHQMVKSTLLPSRSRREFS